MYLHIESTLPELLELYKFVRRKFEIQAPIYFYNVDEYLDD